MRQAIIATSRVAESSSSTSRPSSSIIRRSLGAKLARRLCGMIPFQPVPGATQQLGCLAATQPLNFLLLRDILRSSYILLHHNIQYVRLPTIEMYLIVMAAQAD